MIRSGLPGLIYAQLSTDPLYPNAIMPKITNKTEESVSPLIIPAFSAQSALTNDDCLFICSRDEMFCVCSLCNLKSCASFVSPNSTCVCLLLKLLSNICNTVGGSHR
jgi:hypothetical protein